MITVVAHMDVKWGAPKLDRCQWAELVREFFRKITRGRSGTGMLHKTVPHTVSVRIVTPHPGRALFGVSAAAIVLHDRYVR